MVEIQKVCSKCEQSKDRDQFYPNSRYKDAFMSFCKACLRKNVEDWREKNKNPRILKYVFPDHDLVGTDLAYAAAILDAEGTFVIGESKGKRDKSNIRPIISIYNNDKKLLEVIRSYLGGSLRLVKRKKRKETHRDSFILEFGNQKIVLAVCNKVHDYLVLKKDQCSLVEKACLVPREERYPLKDKIEVLNAKGLNNFEKIEITGVKKPLTGIDKKEWAYLAGWIEGDGNLCFRPWKDLYWYPDVRVYGTKSEGLLYLQDKFGGNINLRRRKEEWAIEGKLVWHDQNYVQRILEGILPYLKVKKQLASILYDSCCYPARERFPFVEMSKKLVP